MVSLTTPKGRVHLQHGSRAANVENPGYSSPMTLQGGGCVALSPHPAPTYSLQRLVGPLGRGPQPRIAHDPYTLHLAVPKCL